MRSTKKFKKVTIWNHSWDQGLSSKIQNYSGFILVLSYFDELWITTSSSNSCLPKLFGYLAFNLLTITKANMEKDNFFLHELGLSQNYFTLNRCVMRTQDQWWCNLGENSHCSLTTKKNSALRLCIPDMSDKSSHHEKN